MPHFSVRKKLGDQNYYLIVYKKNMSEIKSPAFFFLKPYKEQPREKLKQLNKYEYMGMPELEREYAPVGTSDKLLMRLMGIVS